MALGLTNGAFNIVALDPFFGALGCEKSMDLSGRDETGLASMSYTEVCSMEKVFFVRS